MAAIVVRGSTRFQYHSQLPVRHRLETLSLDFFYIRYCKRMPLSPLVAFFTWTYSMPMLVDVDSNEPEQFKSLAI
jgi:hypothetical protein